MMYINKGVQLKKRASDEVNALIAKLMADADALRNKYAEADMPPEDVATLNDIVSQLESLEVEKAEVEASERAEAVKARMNAPTRHAPRVAASKQEPTNVSAGEVLGYWLTGKSSPESVYKLRTAGLEEYNGKVRVPMDWSRISFKNRTALSKGGSGTGAEYIFQSYSDQLIRYLSFECPILPLLNWESISQGLDKYVAAVDNTSMIGTDITASSGTELNPTIPETNLVTGRKLIKCKEITSGFQKVTWQELRDSAWDLEKEVAEANALSLARKIEKDIFTAEGDGSTDVQGLQDAASSAGTPSDWTLEVIKTALRSIPPQYRKDVVLACNDTTAGEIDASLVDDLGRSLFAERTAESDINYDTLLGHKFVVSQRIDDDVLLLFNPNYYKVLTVQGQYFQKFVERFGPMVAWMGMMSYGGAWVGPSSACKKLTKS